MHACFAVVGRFHAAFSRVSSAVRPVRGMHMEEVALRIVYSCLWQPDRLAFRASSAVHALLPVRCEFPMTHCIWDLNMRLLGGPCRAPCEVPDGVCARCVKFSCHAHTFWIYPSLRFEAREDTWDFTRRSLCLRCQVQEGRIPAEQLARWESNEPPELSPFAPPRSRRGPFAAPRSKPQ